MRTTRGMGMQRRHPVLWATLVLACGLCTSPGKGSCGVVSSEPDAQAMALAQEIRRTLAQYADLRDIIAMLGLEQLSTEDRKVVARARRLERFLTQPFSPPSNLPVLRASGSASRTPWTAANAFCAMSSRTSRKVPCT